MAEFLVVVYAAGVLGVFIYFGFLDDTFGCNFGDAMAGFFFGTVFGLCWPFFALVFLAMSPLIVLKKSVRQRFNL